MDHSSLKLSHLPLVAMTAIAFGIPNTLFALELNRYFSNDMVLQRDKPVKVWGTATKDSTVTVEFAGQTAKATADKDARWSATLKPMPASREGRKMVVHSSIGNQRSEVGNLLVGDVFLFARQSSIDVSLGSTPEGKQAAAALAAGEACRFIHIESSPSRTPLDNLRPAATGGWQVVDTKSALAMSAAAFYLGRDLAAEVDVPVGIVDLDMGYHFPSAWLSEKGLDLARNRTEQGCPDLDRELQCRPLDYEAWDKRIVVSKRGRPVKGEPSDKPLTGLSPIQSPICPSVCYNGVIRPLQGLVVKGMLLQLGNDYPYFAFQMLPRKDGNSRLYDIIKYGNRMTPQVLPTAVDDLRSSLGGPSLPLAWIMPPGSNHYQYAAHNREVREVQRRAQAESEGIDLVLPGAEHTRKSGQPAGEALLADRCKQWVMGTFYGAKGPVSGPLFDRVEYGKGAATIHFEPGTAVGLTAEGDALKHFEVAAEDGEFAPCKAEIDGTRIKLASDTVSNPVSVRYGWTRKPVQGLANSAGLPALPFNTDTTWEYDWWPDAAPAVLPEEYHTPANKWPQRDYAVINCDSERKGLHLGPTGLWGAPSGPNLYIDQITPDSPADGKVFVGDMVYGVNGTEFGPNPDDKYVQFAAGITHAETKEGGGTMILNIRRSGKLIEVPIKLEFMGSYSDTSPWNCEKSERIVEKAEAYMRNGMRPETGIPKDDDYAYGPWNDNVLFLLASGNAELQGLVRRYIRRKLDALDAWKGGDKRAYNSYNGWGNDYLVFLLGEYYHRTGDSAVLPHLGDLVRMKQSTFIQARESDPGSWPPTGPSGYGTHPAAQMPRAMGMLLAKEAGVKVDQDVLSYELRHLHHKRAEHGWILYNGYGPFLVESRQIDEPDPIDPALKAEGRLSSMNGKLGTGAALFNLMEGHDKAVKACAERCVYAFNKTRSGHGGAWFNNYWTPIGAYHAGKEKYQHFMKGQQWWRELYRDHSGAVWQAHNAKGKASVLAVGFVAHRVAHHKRLRMFGAPRSAFGPGAPACLKDALAAHRKRDYALAEKLIQGCLAERDIPAEELPTVHHFLETVQTLRKSIEHDLDYTEELLEKGEVYLAALELPQLKMVVAPQNARLNAIAATLESEETKAKIAAVLDEAKKEEYRLRAELKAKKEAKPTSAPGEWTDDKERLVTLVKDGACTFTHSRKRRASTYPEEQWSRWRLAVFETRDHIPEKWQRPDYDDSGWEKITLPTAWRPGHTALMRTTFEVKDATAFDGLQVRAITYKQNDLKIYLNGHVVAKVNFMSKQHMLNLTPYATSLLKDGVNALAVSAEHGMRWVDFSLRLEGRLRDAQVAGD